MEAQHLHRRRLIDHVGPRLANGGRDNGPPGLRPYHADYYAAFLPDPDGNTIEAVLHGTAERSAPSVTIDLST